MLGLRASPSAWPSPAALPGGAPLSFWMGCILETTARRWRCRCLMGQFQAGCSMHLIQAHSSPTAVSVQPCQANIQADHLPGVPSSISAQHEVAFRL